ncbi:MAG: PQQ-dependent sugar dehydrogenase [Candidatus Peribacteraceae bacterium]|nr:PQQ-dependent sugar dehydrogenase [Candidatus Peribacteraceae bacterium]
MRLPSVATGILSFMIVSACAPTASSPLTQQSSSSVGSSSVSSAVSDQHEPEVIADHLNIPWDIAFLPGGDLLVTERPGTLLRIGADKKTYSIDGVRHVGEGGLLGIALHPNFADNHFLYLYMTTRSGENLVNRIERYRFENDELTDRVEILTGIPGAQNHDGGRIEFGPVDEKLYITTGDAGQSNLAQDKNSLAGKILRINDDGSIPGDNPFGNAVWSYGHRNSQGIAWDANRRLWSTEHGRSGVQSGYDELNLIDKGGNYGWPHTEGPTTRDGVRSPMLQSGADSTWAPASAAYFDGSIYFGGLRGEALYEAVIRPDGGQPLLKTHFHGEFGRVRTVRTGPDGLLYLTTSNRDGRGSPAADDDKIIRVNPASLP